MARARNLKPSLFKNEVLGVADPLLTILFESLWCLADREGRLEDRPLRVKAETFPYRDGLDCNVYLTELARMGFICRYEVAGSRYIQVLNFAKHQNPHKTEKASELPGMPEKSDSCLTTVKNTLDNGSHPADSLLPPTDSLELIPDSPEQPGATALRVRKNPRTDSDDAQFIAAWNSYPKRPGSSRADAFKAWSARVKERVDPDAILAGVRRYAEYVEKSGTEPQYIKQPATFFGPSKHWESDWSVQRPQQAAPPSRHSGFDQLDYQEGVSDDGRF